MRAVKGKDTAPEMTVRRLAHRLGYRYRLHRSDLPGKPDMAFPARRKVVLIHGCFWHGHNCSRGSRMPKSNAAYWRAKIGRNLERDKTNAARLKSGGWDVLVIWECQLRSEARTTSRLRRFLI